MVGVLGLCSSPVFTSSGNDKGHRGSRGSFERLALQHSGGEGSRTLTGGGLSTLPLPLGYAPVPLLWLQHLTGGEVEKRSWRK